MEKTHGVFVINNTYLILNLTYSLFLIFLSIHSYLLTLTYSFLALTYSYNYVDKMFTKLVFIYHCNSDKIINKIALSRE